MNKQQMSLFPSGPTTGDDSPFHLSSDTALKAAVGAFKKYMQYEGFSRHTISAFSSDLNLLGKYLGIGQAVGQVSTRNLNDFLKWMAEDRGVPCSPKTYARRVTTLKVFFGWLFKGGILFADPAAAVIQRSVRSPLPTVLTDDEIDRVYEVAKELRFGTEDHKPDVRPLLLFELLLQTGIKKGEAVSIVPNHVDRSQDSGPFIHIRYSNPSKRYKERKVQISPDWINLLDEYLEHYQPPDTIFSCTPRNLEYVLRNLEERAEVNKPVSFESLRWTSAVLGYKQGMDTDLLRERMGLSKVTWRETLSKIKRLASPEEQSETLPDSPP